MTGRATTKTCMQHTTPPRALCARTLCPCAIHCVLLQNHVCVIVLLEPPHRSTAHGPSTTQRTGDRLSPSRVSSTLAFRCPPRALENLAAEPTPVLLQQTPKLTFTLAVELLHLTPAGENNSSNHGECRGHPGCDRLDSKLAFHLARRVTKRNFAPAARRLSKIFSTPLPRRTSKTFSHL